MCPATLGLAQDLQRVVDQGIEGILELHQAMLLLLEQAARHSLLQGQEDTCLNDLNVQCGKSLQLHVLQRDVLIETFQDSCSFQILWVSFCMAQLELEKKK